MNCHSAVRHSVPGDSRAFNPGWQRGKFHFPLQPTAHIRGCPHSPSSPAAVQTCPASQSFIYICIHTLLYWASSSILYHPQQSSWVQKSPLRTFHCPNWGISPLFWMLYYQNMLYLIILHGPNAQCFNTTSDRFLMILNTPQSSPSIPGKPHRQWFTPCTASPHLKHLSQTRMLKDVLCTHW